jgi:hypothetical protein
VAREADYYTVDEAARILGMSPARVRQALRARELEGVRREERIEGVLGPWRIPAHAVRAFQERLRAGDAETTVALSPDEEATADTLSASLPGETAANTPSEASELLSEEVGKLREMTKALLGELDRLEGRLEATEVEHFALRETLRREKERSEELKAELEAERAGRRGSWSRPFES